MPMCGFPIIHLDKHLKTLVQNHHRFVALCEEFPKYGSFGEKSFERRVTRIVTPGTLIDEPFLNTIENNYLLSIHFAADASSIGLAWTDVSTGELFSKKSHLHSLRDELARICPREVVLRPAASPSTHEATESMLKEEGVFFTSWQLETDNLLPADVESAAVSLLSTYLSKNLMENAPTLSNPRHEADSKMMHLDAHTIKSLEIKESTYAGGTKGSLVSVIKRTTTDSGTRLLARRLCGLTFIPIMYSLIPLP